MEKKKEVLLVLLMGIVFICVIGAVIAYNSWQFRLCYGVVSDSWWYCFAHAW